MKCFSHISRMCWAFLVAVTLTLGLGGCEGDDGADGAPGAAGAPGVDGSDGQACWDLNGNGVGDLPDEDVNGDGAVDVADCAGASAKVTPLESCGVCHSDGSFASAPAAHALAPIETVSNVTFAVNGADLDVTFDLAADGVLATNYDSMQRGYRTDGTTRTDICGAASRSDPCDPANLTLTNNGGGSYTVKVLGGAAAAATDSRYLFRVGAGSDRETRVYFYGDFPASPFTAPAVSAEACTACHGPEGIGVHGGYYAAVDGAEPCLTCHGVDVPSLAAVTHGLHNNIWVEDGELIEITYPTYMTNCSVCHNEPAQLAATNAMGVSGAGCFSCHGSIDGFGFEEGNFHLGIADPETADCTVCHSVGGPAANKVAVTDFHNGLSTQRSGLIWNGADAAVTEAERFTWQITEVVDDGTNLAISWTASYDGVGVDPCNDTAGAGAPVFFVPGGGSGGTHSMLRNYAQGDDFILGQSTSAPGQATNVNLTVDNTTCAGNVATTTIPVDDVDATVGRVAIQGKPGVVSPADPAALLRVRVPTPTYDWLLGTSDPAPVRRNVVDTGKCLDCHVGSLYQHGGNRVDNVDMCILCHNSASNEQNVRVGMGVDASEAYDGRVGETYEMKTMLHRIHSANYEFPDDRYNPPYLVYRNRGIYAFARDESLVPNWPGSGSQVVFGSDDVTTNHNFHSATYPRSLNECTACHTADFTVIPDQTISMATTVEAGSEVWDNQLDDVLQGAGTTACVTCHADGASKGHAYQNSWDPQAFPEGRQTIIDAVN